MVNGYFNNMSKPRLILHIGTPKTGTSSLQVFFKENESMLHQKLNVSPLQSVQGGAFSERPLSHHVLAWSLSEVPSYYNEDVHAFENYLNQIRLEVESNKYATYLISSEAFYHENMDISKLGMLKEIFDVKVVCYFRRPDEFVEANYITNIQMPSETAIKIDKFLNYIEPMLDYDAQAKKWEDVFGDESFIAAPFERSAMHGENIIVDFFTRIGHPVTSEFQFSDDSNVRLGRESAVLLWNLKKNGIPVDEFEACSKMLVHLRKKRKDLDVDRYFLSPEERESICLRHKQSYERLFNRKKIALPKSFSELKFDRQWKKRDGMSFSPDTLKLIASGVLEWQKRYENSVDFLVG